MPIKPAPEASVRPISTGQSREGASDCDERSGTGAAIGDTGVVAYQSSIASMTAPATTSAAPARTIARFIPARRATAVPAFRPQAPGPRPQEQLADWRPTG